MLAKVSQQARLVRECGFYTAMPQRCVARIRREVGGFTELRGVHEQRRDDDLVLGPGGTEERPVPIVQRTHCRYEADLSGELQVGDRADDLHVASASVAPASVS